MATSQFHAIVKGKCPQCRRGNIFSGSTYGFNIQRTNYSCSHCEFRFEVEPGYFYAAMYISYAMNMIEMITMGFATYYAKQFEGNQTATGEVFHHSKFTAASNVFALNTWVKVTNILTGRSIIVRINDRMHPRMSQKGRVLDLTYTAAKQLQIVTRGVAKVKVEPISPDVAEN